MAKDKKKNKTMLNIFNAGFVQRKDIEVVVIREMFMDSIDTRAIGLAIQAITKGGTKMTLEILVDDQANREYALEVASDIMRAPPEMIYSIVEYKVTG